MSLIALAQLAQTSYDSYQLSPFVVIPVLAIAIFTITACCFMFRKASQPGWAAVIPIYNLYIFTKIAKRPGWWVVLYLIPLVDIVVHIIVSVDVAKRFGKDTTFGVLGLFLFPVVGYPVLAFGDAKYKP